MEDLGSIPGLGRSPGGGHGDQLQYSCLENPHRQRSLAGYRPWDRKESDMIEQLAQHRVFLISVFVLFISHLLCLYFFYVLGKCVNCVSCIFSILFSRLLNIFTIIILNCFSGRLLISYSYFWSWFLPCSFICAVFLCLFFSFFSSNLLHLRSPFPRL